jgi:mono/diheme cytochrome c family protein
MKSFGKLGIWLVPWLVAASLLTMACRSPRRGEPFTQSTQPLTAEAGRGSLVFAEHCHECHPGGEGGLGPALNDKPLPRFLLRMQIRRGLGSMPAFGPNRISPEELTDLVEYIVALRRARDS